jgi:hypothetical protein
VKIASKKGELLRLEICFNFPLFFLPKDSQLEDERVS